MVTAVMGQQPLAYRIVNLFGPSIGHWVLDKTLGSVAFNNAFNVPLGACLLRQQVLVAM
jgi:hypothetical protein